MYNMLISTARAILLSDAVDCRTENLYVYPSTHSANKSLSQKCSSN